MQSHGTIARWVERTWLAIGGPCVRGGCSASWITCRAVFARLRELEQRGLPDAADLADGFADLYADGGGASAVEIMTIHKAKGLEFDMVVVPALDRHPGSNRDQLLLMHQFARTSRDGMVMAARPAVGADQERLFEFLRRRDQEAAALESERLLYVACTRAKWQLHLTATIDSIEEDSDEGSGGTRTAHDDGSRARAACSPSCGPPWALDFTAAVRTAGHRSAVGGGRPGDARRTAAPRTPRLVAGQPFPSDGCGSRDAARAARGDPGIRLGRRDGPARRQPGARRTTGDGSRTHE